MVRPGTTVSQRELDTLAAESTNVTQGRSRRYVHAAQGELQAASALQQRRLDTNRQLGCVDGIAAALWGLAQIDLRRHDYAAAEPRVAEAYALLARLGRADGIAVVGSVFGQFLVARGEIEEGAAVLDRAAEAYRRLGLEEREVSELLASVRRITEESEFS